MLRPFISAICLLFAVGALGQLDIASLNTDYTIDFDNTVAGVNNGAFQGTGFTTAPAPGELDTDGWRIEQVQGIDKAYGVDQVTGDYALGISTGGITTGGIYSFQIPSGTGNSLGLQEGGDSFPGLVELRLSNSTGDTITSLDLSYVLNVLNDEPRDGILEMYFGNASMEYGPIPGTYFSTNSSPMGIYTPVSINLTDVGVYVPPGEEFFLQLRISSAGMGGRDEFSIDNIVVNAHSTTGVTFYSQSSGLQDTSIDPASALWSTTPTGGVALPEDVMIPKADYVIQNGHTVTWGMTQATGLIDDMTVEVGGILLGSNMPDTPNYMSLGGDLVCDGSIGNPDWSFSSVALNLEAGPHSISGGGPMYMSRIRKSAPFAGGNSSGITTLSIDSDINLGFNGNCLYSNHSNSSFGFNVIINATVNAIQAGIGGANPANNSASNENGSIIINGILNVSDLFFMTSTSNLPAATITTTINNGGLLRSNYINAKFSGAGTHDLNVLDGGTLEITGVSTGTTTWEMFSATNNSYDLEPGSRVEYSSLDPQSIADIQYHHLRLSGAGEKTPTAPINVTIDGDLDILGAAEFIGDNRIITIGGDWTNYGEAGFSEGTGTSEVIFDPSTISGIAHITTTGGELFNNVRIQSNTVVLDSDISIEANLALNSRLELNAHTLSFSQPAAGISIITPTGDELIVSEDVMHQGRICYNSTGVSIFRSFPFGTVSGEPVYCRYTDISANTSSVCMATYPTGVDNMPLPQSPVVVQNLNSVDPLTLENSLATVDRYWSVEVVGSPVAAELELGFRDSEIPSDAAFSDVNLLRAQRYDEVEDKWQPALPTQTLLPSGAPFTANILRIENITQFSPWGIASSASPLPVELLSFRGRALHKEVQLSWETASEKNNAGFEIQRSIDGQTFELIGFVPGAGNSSTQLGYTHIDEKPNSGFNYYRLNQIDLDGQSKKSEVIDVLWQSESASALKVIKENEASVYFELNQSIGPHTVSVIDMNGRTVFERWEIADRGRIPLTGLENGAYLLRVYNSNASLAQRFVK